tara:strand:- start:1804 stop:2133 length:330 start_codon:yes stop_codon:yes gene_type:complete
MNLPDLTDEQTFMLHRIAIETRGYSRDELIEELLGCWEDKFRQKQAFLAASKNAGFAFKFNEGIAVTSFTDEEGEQIDVTEEDDDALQDIVNSANFELDMDAIVLGKDE